MLSSNIIRLPVGSSRQVLIAHQQSAVRHVLRTLIEAEDVIVVEVADGEAALAELTYTEFDLLVLELDLPVQDGITVMQMHRLLLAHKSIGIEPPEIIFTLAPEVRGNATLTDHLRMLGVAGLIDDAPRSEVGPLVEAALLARAARFVAGKPAVA